VQKMKCITKYQKNTVVAKVNLKNYTHLTADKSPSKLNRLFGAYFFE
jgi:hypothetical protein